MKKKKITKAILKKISKRLAKRQFKEDLHKWGLEVIGRDKCVCQKCNKFLLLRKQQNTHHIISLQSVLRKYPALLNDINNGITLCAYCHKFAPDSPHQSALEFVLWLKEIKPEQYAYLTSFIWEY